jgi:acyl carrier protein
MMVRTDFIELLGEELGLQIRPADLDRSLDQLPGWDSVYLLRLSSALERRCGRRIPLPKMLAAGDLGSILQLVGNP